MLKTINFNCQNYQLSKESFNINITCFSAALKLHHPSLSVIGKPPEMGYCNKTQIIPTELEHFRRSIKHYKNNCLLCSE